MADPDDDEVETLEAEQRRIMIENARKSGALIDEEGKPLKTPDKPANM